MASIVPTTNIQEMVIKVERFLAKGMLEDTKTEDEIKVMREQECIEVTVQGQKTELVSLQGLETKFQKQETSNARIMIPNKDILRKSSFPLHETSDDFLKELTQKYNKMYKPGEENIQQKEANIEEQLEKMLESQTAVETARNIADLFDSPNATVRRKMEREIGDALKEVDTTVQKTRIIRVLKNILHEGIDIHLRSKNKTKWGALNNRRGQIGENRTVAAVNQALDEFWGISVMGMKTHTYLYKFLNKLNIKLTYENTLDPATGRVKKTNEVEHDLIATWVEKDTLVVNMIESKTKECKPWAPAVDQEGKAQAAIKHSKDALLQLLKDFTTFKEIFLDIPGTTMKKIRFQFFVSLSDVSCQDWPDKSSSEHILFKEDIDNISRLRSKLKVPAIAPDPDTILPDIKTLHNTIGTRYVGGASFISLKTPQEGFLKQEGLLKNIKDGYKGQVEKVFMLGKEQQAVFHAGLRNYANFGGHGSGKTVLLQASIVRDAENIVADHDSGTNHLQIICIWQKGADALIKQYNQLVSTLPKGDNLEVTVVTKEELMKRFKAKDQNVETTYQINTICKHISQLVKNKQVHLYIDECWITVPKKFAAHLTPGNPNEVVGHIPFLRNGVLYPWSKLDPGNVELSVAVMPDCQHLLEKDLITAPPPEQGPVLTVFAPKSFRTTMRIHSLIQHIQERVELDLRVWRYLLPPKEEQEGHEIRGSLPVWQPINQTDHLICQTDGCNQCFLRNILNLLESHFSDAINIHGAKAEDMVFILNQDSQGIYPDAISAISLLNKKFPGVDIKFDDEFEGMEKPVIFNLTNGSIGTSPSIIPLSLTRANTHLVMFIQDFRNILKDATEKSLVKKSKYYLPSTGPNTEEVQTATGLMEASVILASMARKIPLASLQVLAQEWGIENFYAQLMEQEKTRFQMVELMSRRHIEENPTTTMTQFMESLRAVNMEEAVSQKLADNLRTNINELKDMVTSRNFTDNEQIALAHSLGQRNLFNSLTQPLDPIVPAVSDQEALQRCLEVWNNQATEETTVEGLIKCLLMAGLSRIAVQIQERPTDNSEIASFENMSVKEKIGATVLDVFLPIMTVSLTISYMASLYSNGKHVQFWILLLLHWIPSAFLSIIHIYFNHNVFGSTLNIPKSGMPLLIVFQPASSTVLYVMYLLKRARYTGHAVERYKMQKILQLAGASSMMNNFTSLLVLTFTLHLANTGSISVKEPALFSLSTTATLLHLVMLLINIIKKQINEDISPRVVVQLCLVILAIASSLTLKAVSMVVLLSSRTNYCVLVGCFVFFIGLAANLVLEIKFLANEDDNEVKNTWQRAVHSMIFPFPPELLTRKQVLGVSLQLLIGNIAAASLGFSVTMLLGITEDLLITQNMVKALSVATVCLVLYSTAVYYGISIHTKSSADPLSIGGFEEDNEELSESSPLLGSHDRPQARGYIKNLVLFLILLLMMVLIMLSFYPLLLFQFNTCNSISSNFESHITCDTTLLTVGTLCTMTCSPMHLSSSSIYSSCTWRGAWNVTDLTCRLQVAAVIGMGSPDNQAESVMGTDIYPPTGSRFRLPGLPIDYALADYINGGIILCGGLNSQDPSTLALKACYSLKPPFPRWQETFPLLQATNWASKALIEEGQALLILGGMDAGMHLHRRTQIVRPGRPTEWGPEITEGVMCPCSTTLQDGSVIVTGGQSNNAWSSPKTEVYNFTTKKWSQKKDMNQRRMGHSCTQVWLNPSPYSLISNYLPNISVLSIVVAGGRYWMDGEFNPINSVEVYIPWNDTWIHLLDLPDMEENETHYKMDGTQIMALPVQGDTNRLHLLGGISMDWIKRTEVTSNLVWQLMVNYDNNSYYWTKDYTKPMDMTILSDYSALGAPDNFFSSFEF